MVLFIYTLRFYFKFLFSITLLTVFLFILFDFIHKSTNYLNKYNPSTDKLLQLYLFQIPSLLVQAIPIASLLASVICMVLLSRSNEITAMRAIGMGPLRIGLPIAVGSFVLSLFTVFLGEYIVPHTSSRMHFIRNVEIEGKRDFQLIERARWIRNENILINFDSYNSRKKELRKLKIIRLNENFDPIEFSSIKKAKFLGNGVWAKYGGSKLNIEGSRLRKVKELQGKEFDIGIVPGKLKQEKRSPGELSSSELSREIDFRRDSGGDPTDLIVNLHVKIAFYFASFVVSLIGLKFAYRSERNMETARGVLVALGIGVSYWFILNTFSVLGKMGLVNPILAAWSANIIIGLFSVVEISRESGFFWSRGIA